LIWNVAPQNLMERVAEMFNKDWLVNLNPFEWGDGVHTLYGVTSRAALHFWSPSYMHIFVNQRPVTDKIIKKAIIESYNRQLVPGTYPCSVLFLDIKPDQVDVNVHPRKTEVKFLDPKSIFTIVKNTIDEQIGNQKVSYAHFNQQTIRNQYPGVSNNYNQWNGELEQWNNFQQKSWNQGLFENSSFTEAESSSFRLQQGTSSVTIEWHNYRIISQLRNMYMLLEGDDGILLVDQHALAERIAFEKMRKEFANANTNANALLLTPLVVAYPKTIDIDHTIEQLNALGWDVSRFGDGKVVVYAVPAVFQEYQLDLELLLNHIRGRDSIDFWIILDEIAGMKACKASIKAGQVLSLLEMEQLMKDGVAYIDGMFVCQHGRPSVVAIKKSQLDGMFER
jgi:DNA mismatch repair protein MutL